MNQLSELICRATGALSVQFGEIIQSLWSGYGVIQRATLKEVDPSQVVIKHIDVSQARANRRGWGSDLSHQRKIRSYQVEISFYKSFAAQCNPSCRVPKFVGTHENADNGQWCIVLEDLDAVGFSRRKSNLKPDDLRACLSWLANFHATFMGNDAVGLWTVGTYWHLETRPEEFAEMADGPLKESAIDIDRHLNNARFQTLVHGDAKVANFCFSERNTNQVAAVDFQYVGCGCGMKDVAYFVSSCLDDREASDQQASLLDYYFQQLRLSLSKIDSDVDADALESEWRELYSFAWADFCRFLAGWSPGHWKLNDYSDRVTQSVLKQLATTGGDNGKSTGK